MESLRLSIGKRSHKILGEWRNYNWKDKSKNISNLKSEEISNSFIMHTEELDGLKRMIIQLKREMESSDLEKETVKYLINKDIKRLHSLEESTEKVDWWKRNLDRAIGEKWKHKWTADKRSKILKKLQRDLYKKDTIQCDLKIDLLNKEISKLKRDNIEFRKVFSCD